MDLNIVFIHKKGESWSDDCYPKANVEKLENVILKTLCNVEKNNFLTTFFINYFLFMVGR